MVPTTEDWDKLAELKQNQNLIDMELKLSKIVINDTNASQLLEKSFNDIVKNVKDFSKLINTMKNKRSIK